MPLPDPSRSAPADGVLAAIHGPEDVRRLDTADLARLADEIRSLIVRTVGRNGGHLGSNLGAVEITLALHRVYRSPLDPIVFDTGHQAYAHKLLTGRRKGFAALRQAGGLSGYPSRHESEHDVVENSHASVSLSYADGLARAFRQRGEPHRRVVAVIGDGALTGGVAWEALNNLGADRLPVTVVLNDNGWSYAPTVGGLAGHLAALRAGTGGGTVFENLGLGYLGPIDGHDLPAIEEALRRARDLGRPVVVHCVTRKGRGYPPAENDPEECFHSPGKLDPATGRWVRSSGPTWTATFGGALAALAEQRPELVAVTAAMMYPTGLDALAARRAERVYDVGIAEQHAVTLAAGLAMGGLHPVVALYATFLNRAFDQVLLDVALHGLPVTFALDRAGITGDDGPSHHGIWDLALLSMVPGLRIAAPRDGSRLRELLAEAVAIADGPSALRFPKGAIPPDLPPVGAIGSADVLVRAGDPDVLALAVGATAHAAVAAAEVLAGHGTGVTVLDPRWIKPLNNAVCEAALRHRAVVVLEDGVGPGGVADALRRALAELEPPGDAPPVGSIAVPARFIAHSSRDTILREHGLSDPDAIAALALKLLDHHPTRGGFDR